MPKRDRIHYDIGGMDFGNNVLSVAINGGDYTSVKDALDSLQWSGTADGSGVGYIIDSTANWEVDFFAGGSITIDGTYAGTYIVTSNTATQINITALGNDPGLVNYTVWAASDSKWYQIKVYPGAYIEDNSIVPIRLLDYVVIIGDLYGVDVTTAIMPLDPTKTLFRSAINGYGSMRGIALQGVTGISAYGFLVDSGVENYLYGVQFNACSNGIKTNGSGVICYADYTEFSECDICMYAESQSTLWWTLGFATKDAVGTTVCYCKDLGTELKMTSVDIEGAYTNALYMDNGGYIDFNTVHIEDVVNAVRIGTTGGSIRGNAAYFEEAITYHILDETSFPYTATVRINGIGDATKVSSTNPNSMIQFYGYTEEVGHEGFTIGGRFISPWQETIYVSRPGGAIGDYDNIKDAVDSILDASASKPYCIVVYPGIYPEDNPITLKPYVSLFAVAGSAATKITANNINSHLIVLDAGGEIRGITVSGATGAAGIYYSAGASAAAILDSAIDNCLNGIVVTGTNSQMYLSRMRFTGNISYPLIADSGSSLFFKMTRILSSGNIKAVSATGASSIDIEDLYVNVTGGGDGIFIDGGSNIITSSCDVNNVDYSLHLGTSGINKFNGDFDSYNSSIYDIYDEGAGQNNTHIAHGHILKRKIEIGNNILTGFLYDDLLKGYEVQAVTNRFAVGSTFSPTESLFGEGDHKTRYMEVLTNTNEEVGTWVDETINAVVNDGNFFNSFPSVSTDASLYIGWNIPWYGFRYEVGTAIDLGTGAIIFEYWNGSAWVSFHTMVTMRSTPYTLYSGAFQNINGVEHVRFDSVIGDDWASKTLNSITSYWIRIRITSDITTVPTLDFITIHANSMSIRDDGFIHYFGTTRYSTFKDVVPTRIYSNLSLKSAVSENLNISNSLSIYDDNNVLNTGEVNEIMFEPFLIKGSGDVSCPIGLHFICATPATTGNIEFKADLTIVLQNVSAFNGVNPKMTITKIVAADTTPFKAIYVEMDTYLANLPLGGVAYVRLYRDARSSNVNDTIGTTVAITAPKIVYTTWRESTAYQY